MKQQREKLVKRVETLLPLLLPHGIEAVNRFLLVSTDATRHAERKMRLTLAEVAPELPPASLALCSPGLILLTLRLSSIALAIMSSSLISIPPPVPPP